jgi:rhodanese-related sulfurtransferase
MAAEKLQTLGYTNVRAYEGGIEEWKRAGHTVEVAEQQQVAA